MLDKAKNQGLPAKYLRNINVRWFRFDLEDMHTILASPAELKQLSVEDGDLFVCEGGEPGRCSVWRGGDNVFVYQKALHRFRSHGGMVPELLMYRLRHVAETGALAEVFTGTTIKHLTRESLARFKVPVPPLPEQNRIADKLGALLARVEACRGRLDRVPGILKRLRQSVLAAATNGELTREWREERGFAREWTETRVGEIAFVGTGSTPLRSNNAFYSDSGTPWITSSLTGLPFVARAEEFVTDAAIAAHRLKKYPVGTLLVAMYGEGKTRGQVTELRIEATINQACAAICVDARKAMTAFVRLALEANYIEMRELAKGGNQPNLNLSKIKEFPLSLPSLEEQRAITARVEAISEWLGRIDTRLNVARSHVDHFTSAALAKAFRGELVPQDPNDEPASQLLARLRTRPTSTSNSGRLKRSDARGKREVTSVHPTTVLNERGALIPQAM